MTNKAIEVETTQRLDPISAKLEKDFFMQLSKQTKLANKVSII